MFENKKTHKSYGMIQFSRITSSKAIPLFGSSIKHRDTIVLRIKEAEMVRELNKDHIFDRGTIVEVEMSQSQFAEAITSLNNGSGVPATIKWTREDGRIEECDYEDKRQVFENEFKQTQVEQKKYYDEFSKYLENLLDDKKTLGKKDKEDIMRNLDILSGRIFSNTEFVYKQFNEQMDKTVLEAKGEIEAFMQNKINSIASAALVENKDKFKTINNPIDI